MRKGVLLTSIFVLIARLTLSINTSNSSRHLRGEPIASQIERSRQIDENDFSPPERVLVFRPTARFSVLSGSTWKFQRFISSQSRANFLYLLSERGFRGKLLLDHEHKTLDLQVESSKQMDEKDFSPPERVLVFRPTCWSVPPLFPSIWPWCVISF